MHRKTPATAAMPMLAVFTFSNGSKTKTFKGSSFTKAALDMLESLGWRQDAASGKNEVSFIGPNNTQRAFPGTTTGAATKMLAALGWRIKPTALASVLPILAALNGSNKATQVLAAAGKSAKDGAVSRSALLKLVMPHLSGAKGDALAHSLARGNVKGFENAWNAVTRVVVSEATKKMKAKADSENEKRPEGGKTKVSETVHLPTEKRLQAWLNGIKPVLAKHRAKIVDVTDTSAAGGQAVNKKVTFAVGSVKIGRELKRAIDRYWDSFNTKFKDPRAPRFK